MLRNMASRCCTHEAIKTTLPKAKELRRVVEPLITLAKEATRRQSSSGFDRLRDRDIVDSSCSTSWARVSTPVRAATPAS